MDGEMSRRLRGHVFEGKPARHDGFCAEVEHVATVSDFLTVGFSMV
jgi:hypothetical protein